MRKRPAPCLAENPARPVPPRFPPLPPQRALPPDAGEQLVELLRSTRDKLAAGGGEEGADLTLYKAALASLVSLG